jgi:hypothetical protein
MFSVQRNCGIVVIPLPNIVKFPQSGVFGESRTGNIAQTFPESVSEEKEKKQCCNKCIYRIGLGRESKSHLVWEFIFLKGWPLCKTIQEPFYLVMSSINAVALETNIHPP